MTASVNVAPVKPTKPASRGTAILVKRLAEWVDPFCTLGVSEAACQTVPYLFEEPLFEGVLSNRTRRYHIDRIRWFATQFRTKTLSRSGLAIVTRVDPIEIDCHCDRGRVYPEPILLDGHHRFAGAILAGAERIRVSFGGRLDLLRYLQGRRKTRPN